MKIVECELKDTCSKYNQDCCFNEYSDVCSTRMALKMIRLMRNVK